MSVKNTEAKAGCFRHMFVLPSKWRKASKCKYEIQSLLSSIQLQRKRRESMVRQSQSDIYQLLLNGRISEAIPKAKKFYEDGRRLSAYNQVENFCKSLVENFPSLKHESDVNNLPKQTREAMAGLIFSASRIGELHELQHIKSLFFERFGTQFDKECVHLLPGNLVSSEIVKILKSNILQDDISEEALVEISQGRDRS